MGIETYGKQKEISRFPVCVAPAVISSRGVGISSDDRAVREGLNEHCANLDAPRHECVGLGGFPEKELATVGSVSLSRESGVGS